MKIKTFSFNYCVPSKGENRKSKKCYRICDFLGLRQLSVIIGRTTCQYIQPKQTNNIIDVLKQNTKNESNALLFCSNIQYSCPLWTHNQIKQWRRMPFDQPMPHKFMKIMDAMPTATRRRSPRCIRPTPVLFI